MIEPVFIGLLATAFGFLFLQLVNVRKEAHSGIMRQMEEQGDLSYACKVVSKGKWIGKRYQGVDGLKKYYGDVLLGIALSYLLLVVPLSLYVGSMVALIGGYWFAGELFVAIGLGLLMSAFGACGVSLCGYYFMGWMGVRRAWRMTFEKEE